MQINLLTLLLRLLCLDPKNYQMHLQMKNPTIHLKLD
jgi:hypothetical protein